MVELVPAVMLDACDDAMVDNEDVISTIESGGSGMLLKAVSHLRKSHSSSGFFQSCKIVRIGLLANLGLLSNKHTC